MANVHIPFHDGYNTHEIFMRLPTICCRGRSMSALVLLIVFMGCNASNLYPVQGMITYEGKPVPNGTVNFIPNSNGPTATGEITNGFYRLSTHFSGDGAQPGTYRVIIVAMEDQAERLPEERSPLPAAIVPVRYTSLATSDLTATIDEKQNKIDFDLK